MEIYSKSMEIYSKSLEYNWIYKNIIDTSG